MLHDEKNASARSAALRLALGPVLVAGAVAAAGCSSLPSMPSMPSFGWSSSSPASNASAEALYNEGVQLLSNKKYVPAIERFQKLRSEYPFAPEIVAAEIKLGEAYYLNKQYTEAVETLKEFEGMHPNNDNIPYALYLSGMSHFDQFASADRDQKNTEIAKGFFERVVNNYPKSSYAPKAQEKLAKCLDYLAEHEFDIATYYMREKKYPAARDRFEGIIRRYRTTAVAPKALYQLGESYRLEKNNVKAALAFEALAQHYPDDALAKNARSQLTQLAQEKQDPLAALLKSEGRPTAPVLAENKKQTEANAKEAPRVAKTEVVNEKPGDEKSLVGRMIDKVNPFSSSSPAPAKDTEKKDAAATQTKTVSAKNSQMIGTIDESLKRRGIDGTNPSARSVSDPLPPAADLPQITEATLPPAPDEAATLSAIDGKLAKQGKNTGTLPAPPEAAPILKTPIDEKALATAKTAAQRLPDGNALLSSIDSKLKRQGIDATNTEEPKLETPKIDRPAVVARPKAADKVLEPRLPTEKGPLFLPSQEVPAQEKPADDAVANSDPAKSAPTLSERALKPPPQAAKPKPAETKLAAKSQSSEEDDVENKGILDQLKEDFGRVGKILNPFSW